MDGNAEAVEITVAALEDDFPEAD
jgi:hypothetical protein